MKMVRAVALATVIGAATADGLAAQPVIGFRLGLSMSKASTEFSDPDLATLEESSLTSFGGGGFIRFGAGMIALQPELMYVTKGVKFEDDASDAEVKFKLDYIEVPVLLYFGLGAGTLSPYFVVGPAFSFEAKCSVEAELDGQSASEDCDDGGESDRKKLDIGGMVGAGLAFPAGPGSFIIDGRYNHGFMNIVDDESEDEFKNRMFFFTAGYQIPLGIR